MYFHSAQPPVVSEGSSSADHTVEAPWCSLQTLASTGWPLPSGCSGLHTSPWEAFGGLQKRARLCPRKPACMTWLFVVQPRRHDFSPTFKVKEMHHFLSCGWRYFPSIFGSSFRKTVDIPLWVLFSQAKGFQPFFLTLFPNMHSCTLSWFHFLSAASFIFCLALGFFLNSSLHLPYHHHAFFPVFFPAWISLRIVHLTFCSRHHAPPELGLPVSLLVPDLRVLPFPSISAILGDKSWMSEEWTFFRWCAKYEMSGAVLPKGVQWLLSNGPLIWRQPRSPHSSAIQMSGALLLLPFPLLMPLPSLFWVVLLTSMGLVALSARQLLQPFLRVSEAVPQTSLQVEGGVSRPVGLNSRAERVFPSRSAAEFWGSWGENGLISLVQATDTGDFRSSE